MVHALVRRNIARLVIWNRNQDRSAELARHATALDSSLASGNLQVSIAKPSFDSDLTQSINLPIHPLPDLIVHTTPIGMWPHIDESPWPADLPFPPGALIYDLVYRPERTMFLRQAEAAGCPVQGGLEMLIVQGATAFELWTGQKPPLDMMRAAARAALAE